MTLSWKLDPVSLSDSCLVLVCGLMTGGAGRCRCAGGIDVSFAFSGTTVNRSTEAVVPAVAAAPGLARYRWGPGLCPVKSTITSYRSDGSTGSDVCPASSTGWGRNPPSLPITHNGTAAVADAPPRGQNTTFTPSARNAAAAGLR